MKRTLEAVIDKAGTVRLLEPALLDTDSRALVTILDEPPPKTEQTAVPAQPGLAALLENWDREFGERADPDLDEQLRSLEEAPVQLRRR